MPVLPVRACLTMEKDRQRLLEDKKAFEDAIRRAVVLGDGEEINRLTKHLEWLDNYLKENKNEGSNNSVVPAGD